MRKYQYRESYNVANILGRTYAIGIRMRARAKFLKYGPIKRYLRPKLFFYYWMIRQYLMIKKFKKTDFISQADSIKLLDMWKRI